MKMTANEIVARRRQHAALCAHEAGHVVAGLLAGAQLRRAFVIDGKMTGVRGQTIFDTGEGYPEHRAPEIAYAGAYSQARFEAGGRRRPTQRELFAVLDRSAREDCGVLSLAGGLHTGQLGSLAVDRHWASVVSVARLLARQGEITHADACAALGIRDNGGPASADLAMIRSGTVLPPITREKATTPA